jgi:elongation factor 1-beta
MGEVIVVFRILPKEPKDFGSVKKAVDALKPQRLEEDPIGFGLSALKATFIIPDASGVLDELEEKLNRIEGVNGVETLAVSRGL